MGSSQPPDEQLLQEAGREPEGFGEFYRRHERVVLGFFVRATGRGELAIDLAAETFARAFESRRSFDARQGGARAWLFGIARHVLASGLERGRVEAAARERLGMAAVVLDDRLVAAVEEAACGNDVSLVQEQLARLPADQRRAVRERVLEERSYKDIASDLECSEAVVRQRVSRGLSLLRRDLGGGSG
jgi:RNA polymerase sigma factor (sigma-70 family)